MNASKSDSISRLLALPVQPASEFANWQPEQGQKSTKDSINKPSQDNLTRIEERYLRAVLQKPGQPSSAYAALTGIGTHQAIKARKRLVVSGFLREHRLQTAARGRASVVLEPLPAASAWIAKESR